MFASRGQLPTKENADISNCNLNWCELVKTIKVDIGSESIDEDWYVGVLVDQTEDEPTSFFSVAKPKNITYGIWYNSTCVPGCKINKRGTCMDTGLCSCSIDYTGIDCGICK